MKRYLSRIIPAFLILWIFLYSPGVITDLKADPSKGSTAKSASANVGYLENILFEKSSGREKVSLVVSQQPVLLPPTLQSDNSLLIRLENLYAPENVRQILPKRELLNIAGVKVQQQTSSGKQWVYLTLNLKESVPYSIRQEGKLILIDFNISAIESKLMPSEPPQSAPAVKLAIKNNKEEASVDDAGLRKPARRESVSRSSDRMVSLDFQDADIKSVLRLMAEYGNTSIVAGDDVKGNVTLAMRNVPWKEALDAILKVHGLTKLQMGDITTVITLERKKKDEKDKKDAEADMIAAEALRVARETQLAAEKGQLRQILIEAKIVEASEDFVRNLGIQWGFGNTSSIGSYGLGAAAGTNPFADRNVRQLSYPSEIPYSTSLTSLVPFYMAGVNMPTNIIGPTLGLVFGGARGFIETQLSALEVSSKGKIISSPRVVTMDNVKATIKQGDEIPYITPGSGNSPATVTFKEAMIKLEVQPKITDEGRISLKIKATKDAADWGRVDVLKQNPPIRKNEVESKVVVNDGDTVVMGGVVRDQEDTVVSGLPWLYKVPVLGWLFKTDKLTKEKRLLMIFVTPKILSDAGFIDDDCKTDYNLIDRCRKRQ